MRRLQFPLALLVLALALIASACGGSNEAADTQATGGGTDTASAVDPCAKDQLELATAGQLTIATDNPAFPPWFQDAEGAPWDPTTEPTGQGYEAAVAYAVAEELGFSEAEVAWVVVPFDNVFKPGPKDFDFDVNQVSYKPERDEAVDFSDSYYDVEQAVVTLKSSKFAGAKTLAELQGAKLGAQVGTTSFDAIVNTIQSSKDPNVYNTNNDAISALKNRQIDGLVVDFPSTGFITAVQVPNATTVGRLPAEGQEYFGLVFEEGSSLRDCVNGAIASLRESGRLDEIAQEWLESSSPPVLK
ncbi:MAG: transporter substrate-binding domain-containing protein [Gaiellaceae bacterium]